MPSSFFFLLPLFIDRQLWSLFTKRKLLKNNWKMDNARRRNKSEMSDRKLKQKALFYTTAFFVLLGTFSLFSFLFLVPFVIEPAFQTIFMEFDENRAQCFTDETIMKAGTRNCTWTSCREGCTRDIYTCESSCQRLRCPLTIYAHVFRHTDIC